MSGRNKKISGILAGYGRQTILAGMVLATPLLGLRTPAGQATPDQTRELTYSQFRSLIEARRTREKAAPDLRLAGRVFSQLLIAQAKEAAARQSVDRLSGWGKAIQARFQAQSAPALDVEMIRFAEAKASAESAQYEAERRGAVEQANSLLGRAADTPLVALLQPPSARAPEGSGGSTELSPLEKLEKELLPQGQELLAKLYQSYLFGGIFLSSLLWHEQEVYKAELQYRVWMARAAMESSSAGQGP